MSEEKIKTAADGTSFSPGSGGWPTIRYFNKDTGIAGKPYTKKTDKAMCDELKDMTYMQAYVEEAAGTSLCKADTGAGCTKKEVDYADKWKTKEPDEVATQLARLTKMLGDKPEKLTDDAKTWIRQRKAILAQLGRDAAEL